MRLTGNLIGLFLFTVVLIGGCRPAVEQLVADGGHAMKAKDWATASKAFEQALKTDPTQAEVYRALAVCRIALGDRESAAEALRGLLRLRPDDCRAHLLLAQYAAEQGRWDDAVSHIVRARRFAQYKDEIATSQYWLEAIRSVVTSATAEVSTTILSPTGETQ
jgi:Flp pilus assembly protein TadD